MHSAQLCAVASTGIPIKDFFFSLGKVSITPAPTPTPKVTFFEAALHVSLFRLRC